MRDAAQVFRDAVKMLLVPPVVGGLAGAVLFLINLPSLEKDHWRWLEQYAGAGFGLGIFLGLFWCALGVFEQLRIRLWVLGTILAFLLSCGLLFALARF